MRDIMPYEWSRPLRPLLLSGGQDLICQFLYTLARKRRAQTSVDLDTGSP